MIEIIKDVNYYNYRYIATSFLNATQMQNKYDKLEYINFVYSFVNKVQFSIFFIDYYLIKLYKKNL